MKEKVKKINIDELDRYNHYIATFRNDTKGLRAMSLNEFLSKENAQAIIADFTNSNFSFCNFSGSNLSNVVMAKCNFSGADFSNRIVNSQFSNLAAIEDFVVNKLGIARKKTIMSYGNFNDSNFSWANLDDVEAASAQLNGVTGINLSAQKANFSYVNARNSFFNGSFLKGVEAFKIRAQESCFDLSICDDGIFFDKANLSHSFFKGKFNNSRFSGSILEGARLEGDLSKVNLKEAHIENADLSRVNIDQKNKPIMDGYLGSPIDDAKSIDLRQNEIDKKKEAKRKLMVSKVAFLFIVGATMASIGLPVSLAAFGIVPHATIQPLITSAMYSLGVFTFDAISFVTFGKSMGASQLVANVFGANRVIEVDDRKIEKNLVDLKHKKDNLILSSNDLTKNERIVIDRNKSRSEEKGKNTSFVERELKKSTDGRNLARSN